MDWAVSHWTHSRKSSFTDGEAVALSDFSSAAYNFSSRGALPLILLNNPVMLPSLRTPDGCFYLQWNKFTNCLHFGILGFGKCEMLHFHQSRKGGAFSLWYFVSAITCKCMINSRGTVLNGRYMAVTGSPGLSHLHCMMTSEVTMGSVKGKGIYKWKARRPVCGNEVLCMLVWLGLLSLANINPDFQRQTHHQQRFILTAVWVCLLPKKGK